MKKEESEFLRLKKESSEADPSYEATSTALQGPAELRARFGQASNELAFLGYVKAYKRRRRDEGGGAGAGPKGAVTRLVYAYTMEGGGL